MCSRPPEGWICYLDEDHDGPCPAWPNLATHEGVATWISGWNGEWPDAERIAEDTERYHRLMVAKEIRQYSQSTHAPHAGNVSCPRCDIEAVLLTLANKIEAGTL